MVRVVVVRLVVMAKFVLVYGMQQNVKNVRIVSYVIKAYVVIHNWNVPDKDGVIAVYD